MIVTMLNWHAPAAVSKPRLPGLRGRWNRIALGVCALVLISEIAWAQSRPRSRGRARATATWSSDALPSDSVARTLRRRVISNGNVVEGEYRTVRDDQRRDTLADGDSLDLSDSMPSRYRSRADSLASRRASKAADRAGELRIVISLNDRQLWAILGADTLLVAPVAVSTDETFSYAGRTWTFETPRGVRTIRAKSDNPVWVPPDWHYAEVAQKHGLKLAAMTAGKPTVLSTGNRLEVRDKEVGVVDKETGEFALLPTDEEVIFDGTLFIPPVGTLNRRIEGELGRHMLDTGNGFLLHGTPYKASIGTAATHGCIRLRDPDIEWLYDMAPVGTRVYIY